MGDGGLDSGEGRGIFVRVKFDRDGGSEAGVVWKRFVRHRGKLLPQLGGGGGGGLRQ